MRWSRVGIGLGLLVLLSTFAPASSSLHGGPYLLKGTATPPTGAPVWDSELRYSGAAFPLGMGTYRITLIEPQTGLIVHDARWVVKETFTNHLIEPGEDCPFLEIWDFHGETAPGGEVLSVDGHAVGNLCTGGLTATATGTYLVWTLDLST